MQNNSKTRGIRGAITIAENTPEEVKSATIELLNLLIQKNGIETEDISHVIFTVTTDIDAAFPALYARKNFGWDDVAMICTNEIPVQGSLKMCIRVLIVVNTTLKQSEIKHIYLKGAERLRPDLALE